jgi:hypothetical protein
MIWLGIAKLPGEISSLRLPTAEKEMIAATPRDLRAAMLAREGTEEGGMVWPWPWRARKAIWVPEGREAMVMGAEGWPQGVRGLTVRRTVRLSRA